MTRPVALLLFVLGLLFAGLAVPAAVVAGDPCFHSMARPATTTGATVEIAIGDCVFVPTVTYVPVGSTVQWKNTSSQPHEVVGANLTWGAHEKLLSTGDTIGWTFDKSGVFAYTCMLHPGMIGAIVVGDAVASTDTGAQTVDDAATTAIPLAGSTGGAALPDGAAPIAAIGAAVLVLGLLALAYVRRRDRMSAA